MNTPDTTNRLRRYGVIFEGLEVWTLEALLAIVKEQAKDNGLELLNIEVDVEMDFEGFDDSSDFDRFSDKLKAKGLRFGFELEED